MLIADQLMADSRTSPEASLSRDKELAQVTLASIGDGVIRTDSSGCIDYMNPAAERLTGWSLDEATSRDIGEAYQVIHESNRRPRRNPVELCLVEKRTIVTPGLFALRSRDGEEFIIRDSVAPILGPRLGPFVLVEWRKAPLLGRPDQSCRH